jgi:CheY-like chemotaxis protein
MRLKIVVIDPSPEDRRWLRLMFEEVSFEHDVLEFPSGVMALSNLRDWKEPVDWIFLNSHLPFLEIGEAISRLSELPACRAARFAITVIHSSDADNLPAGCAYLLKPVAVDHIRTLLFGSNADMRVAQS